MLCVPRGRRFRVSTPRRSRDYSSWAVRILAVFLPLAMACGGGASTGPAIPARATPVLTTITVLVSAVTIGVGQTTKATAIGFDQNGAVIDIGTPAWSSEEPSVAAVNATGVVRGASTGHVNIVATVNGKTGRAAMTVFEIPVARVTVSPAEVTLVAGTTQQLTVAVLDGEGLALQGRAIEWTSSDPTRATVSPGGVVTAVAIGSSTVSATSGGVTAKALVFVTGATAGTVASIVIAPATANLSIGMSLQLTASLRDADGNLLTGRDVSWTVTAPSGREIATVSATGLVRAIAVGSAVVEATSDGRRASVAVVVRENLDPKIVVLFGVPVLNGIVGDSLSIFASVRSVDTLSSVVAFVGSIRLVLEYKTVGARGTAPGWVGLMDISELPSSPQVLTVVATDVTGAFGRGTIVFVRDTRAGKGGSGKPPPKNK